jgi:hypothetical protein
MVENIYKHPLHSNIEKFPGGILLVGNTGLKLLTCTKPWEQHFLPDDFDPDKPKPIDIVHKIKYAQIYPYALWNLINSKIEIRENQTITGITHKEMNNFRNHLLTPKIYESFQLGASILYAYNFHIGQLFKEKEILQRIEKLAISCAKKDYLMLWP